MLVAGKDLEYACFGPGKCMLKLVKGCLSHHRRRHRKKSPGKASASASAIVTSINRTFFTCKRRLVKILSQLPLIRTPNTSRYKGYKRISRTGSRDRTKPQQERKSDKLVDLEKDAICKALFSSNDEKKLPPSISPTKRTVFLDLDETLVHSKADPQPERFDFIVRPRIDGVLMNFYVLKRPGVDAFLQGLAAKYEVVVFTAGLKEYASLVLDKLDPKGLIFSHRLYRDSCKQVDGMYVKDLSETGRDLRRAVIVDDNPNCYLYQPQNAIPARPFIDDLGDVEMDQLGKFFESCDSFEDMRVAVKEYVSTQCDFIAELQG
ncbi:hypothetical protein Tsubulata_009817 [Turnera subulata]|uniref:FCP1 homology domain-containing protein n=1 Tax=Turnera subulata TaxID=218843 RepID=A0A9Q0G8N2_9ROSI|nr:hypothetical protein Tsubulata_009817 [Turnera subulata]